MVDGLDDILDSRSIFDKLDNKAPAETKPPEKVEGWGKIVQSTTVSDKWEGVDQIPFKDLLGRTILIKNYFMDEFVGDDENSSIDIVHLLIEAARGVKLQTHTSAKVIVNIFKNYPDEVHKRIVNNVPIRFVQKKGNNGFNYITVED